MRRVLLVCVLTLLGCSTTPQGSEAEARPDRSELTSEAIARVGAQDAFTAIQTLRPHWLRVRGTTSFRNQKSVRIYLDGNLMGGPAFLRQISAESLGSVKYLDGLEASQRYGLDHGEGAILLFTRVGRN